MTYVEAHTPLKTLLALHQLVDNGIEPLFTPMGLDRSTESIMSVNRSDLLALADLSNPQAVLASIEPGPGLPAVLIAEPSLCNTILARIWRSKRNDDAPLTQVEGAILQQFLHDVLRQWRASWQVEGIEPLPGFTMAAPLSMLGAQMPDGVWHVARTVVMDSDDSPVGVLLFCYPDALMPTLVEARDSIRWRTRINRGLTEGEQAKLGDTIARFSDLKMPVPVTFSTEVPLGVINQLERGDVIALDEPVGGSMHFNVLGRELTARLASCRGSLALVVDGVAGQQPFGGAGPDGFPQPEIDPYGAIGDAGADQIPFDPQQSF